jgi:hypothetical protein
MILSVDVRVSPPYTADKLIDAADLPWRASATLGGGGGLSVTLRGIAKVPSAALPPPAATDRPCVSGAGLGLPADRTVRPCYSVIRTVISGS